MKSIEKELARLDYIESLIGDTPVSTQIGVALDNHTHNDFVTVEKYNALVREIERIIELIGDIPVSEQINAAIQYVSK